MSRVAKKLLPLPNGVALLVTETAVTVKGPKGELSVDLPPGMGVEIKDGVAQVAMDGGSLARAGTLRALLGNMVEGVSNGFQRKLELIGVGYRASMTGRDLNLTLGFSHPILFSPPEGISIETPTQTEVLIKGNDKQVVGQVAAKIRSYRPPEPYKGKGVRYSGEKILMKEAKKA